MRIPLPLRSILLTSVASAGLIVGSVSFSADALARSGDYLTPSTQWAVSKVGGQNGGGGYCALARRFDSDAIMTLAKNQSSQTSFALDFQTPKFTVGQTLGVTLESGAGLKRSQQITASSRQAFVVKLGNDQAFLDAVEDTGIVKVGVAGESYIFNISDMDAGQIKLNSCLASIGGGRDVSAPAAVPVHAGANFDAELSELRREVDALKDRNRSLQGRLEKSSYQSATAPSADSVRRLSQRIETLETQNRELRLEAQQLRQSSYEDDTQSIKISRRVEELERENASLMSSLQAVEAQSADSSEVAALEAENASLQGQLEQNQVDITALRDELEAVRSEKLELQSAKSDVASEQDAIISNLEATVEELRADNLAKTEALADARALTAELESLKAQNKIFEDRIEQGEVQQETLGELEAYIKTLEESNASLQAEYSALEAMLDENRSESTEQYASLQERLLQYEADKAALSADNAALNEKLAALSEAKAALETQLSNADDEASSIEALRSDVEGLEEAKANLEAEKANLEEALAARDTETSERAAALQEEQQALEEKLAKVEMDNAALEDQLAAYEASNATLEGELAKTAEDQDAIKILRSDNQSLKEAKNKLENQKAELEALLEEKRAESNEQAATLQGEQERLKEQLEETEANYQAVNAEKEDLLARIETLESGQADIAQVRASYEDQIASYEAEIAALQAEIAEAGTGYDEKIALLEQDNGRLQAALDDARTEIDSLKAQSVREEDLAALQQENSSLRAELETVLGQSQDYDSALAESQQRVALLLRENEGLRSDLQAMNFAMASMEPAAGDEEVAVEEEAVVQVDAETPVRETEEIAADEGADPVRAMVEQAAQAAKEEPVVEEQVEDDTQPEAEPMAEEGVVEEEKLDEQSEADIADAKSEAVSDDDVEEQVSEGAEAEEETVADSDQGGEQEQDFMDQEMSQAQIYEEQMKRSMQNQAMVEDEEGLDVQDSTPDPSVEISDLPEENDGNNVEMRMSQDPFEDMAVEGEDGEIQDSDSEREPVREVVLSDEDNGSAGQAGRSIGSVLETAQIVSAASIEPVDSALTAGVEAYQWRADGIYGSSMHLPLKNADAFDAQVKDYLNKTQERCTGDFAVVPDASEQFGDTRIDSYEVACVGADVNSAASVVFYNDDGVFTVVAHEASAENMDKAMALRDRVFAALKNSSRS